MLGNENDEFRRLSLTNGFLELRDLPAGDYTLHLHATGTVIPLLSDLGSWNLLVGMGLMIAGFGVSTQWK